MTTAHELSQQRELNWELHVAHLFVARVHYTDLGDPLLETEADFRGLAVLDLVVFVDVFVHDAGDVAVGYGV